MGRPPSPRRAPSAAPFRFSRRPASPLHQSAQPSLASPPSGRERRRSGDGGVANETPSPDDVAGRLNEAEAVLARIKAVVEANGAD